MVKALKYLLVVLSIILSVFGNYSARNDVGQMPATRCDSEAGRTFFIDNSLNPFCILHRNEDISSSAHTSLKTNHSRELFNFACDYTHLTPGTFAFYLLSERIQYINSYLRLILFPFHFFF